MRGEERRDHIADERVWMQRLGAHFAAAASTKNIIELDGTVDVVLTRPPDDSLSTGSDLCFAQFERDQVIAVVDDPFTGSKRAIRVRKVALHFKSRPRPLGDALKLEEELVILAAIDGTGKESWFFVDQVTTGRMGRFGADDDPSISSGALHK
jgi:hypothetical protein